MIGIESTVHLAAKARLRFDRHSNKHMILYPERGLVLSETAADVVTLVTEARKVASIVDRLVERYGEDHRATITRDVVELLQNLAEKGLIREVEP